MSPLESPASRTTAKSRHVTQVARCACSSPPGTVCWPLHRHHDQNEWIYIIDGEFEFWVGEKRFRARAGETVFLPRKVAHTWLSVGDRPGKVLDTFEPAGAMEEFFREVGAFTTPAIHEVLGVKGLARLFQAHGMELLGPPPAGEWQVDAQGQITQTA
jgi:mannose-6-phosphate isomerase-like protein (cupin superfamily)